MNTDVDEVYPNDDHREMDSWIGNLVGSREEPRQVAQV